MDGMSKDLDDKERRNGVVVGDRGVPVVVIVWVDMPCGLFVGQIPDFLGFKFDIRLPKFLHSVMWKPRVDCNARSSSGCSGSCWLKRR